MGARSLPQRVGWTLFAGLTAVYVLVRPYSLLSVDEELLYRTTVRLAEQGSFWIVPPERPADARLNPDALIAAKYGVLPSLAAVPFYWLSNLAAAFAPDALADDVHRAVTASASACWMAMAVVVFASLLGRLGRSPGVIVATALVVGLATPVLVYARSFHIVAMSALLVTALVAAAERYEAVPSRSRAITLGTVQSLLLLTSLQFLLLLPVVGWFVWWSDGMPGSRGSEKDQPAPSRTRSLAHALTGVGWVLLLTGMGAVLVMAANYLRTDARTWEAWRRSDGLAAIALKLTRGGYAGENFITPLRVGLYGLLVSPARGLLWFCPAIVVGVACFGALWCERPRLAWLVAAVVGVVVVSSAKWWAWNGGLNWGPRYLVAIVPLGLLPAAYCFSRWAELDGWRRAVVALLVVVSGIVQLRGAMVDYNGAVAPVATLAQTENERWFVPQLSPLWWDVDVPSGLLWVRWYRAGYVGLTVGVVSAMSVIALVGFGFVVRSAGGLRGLRWTLRWPAWGALVGVALVSGAYDICLSMGHGLRAGVPSAGVSEVQFDRNRWTWQAPADGHAEWTGYLRVPQNGDFYRIYLAGNGATELEIADTVRLKHPRGAPGWSVWNGRLDEGLYPLTLTASPPEAKAVQVGLAWTLHGSSIDRQPIGPQFLYPDRPTTLRLLLDRAVEWSWFAVLLIGLFFVTPTKRTNARDV